MMQSSSINQVQGIKIIFLSNQSKFMIGLKNKKVNRSLIWIDADINIEENKKYKIQLNDIFENCFYINSI